MEITDNCMIRCIECGKANTVEYLQKSIRCPFCGCKALTITPKNMFEEMRKYILETTTLKEHRDFLDNQEEESE